MATHRDREHRRGASDKRETFKNLLPNCHKIEPPLDHRALGKVETLLKKRDVAAFIFAQGTFIPATRQKAAVCDGAQKGAGYGWTEKRLRERCEVRVGSSHP